MLKWEGERSAVRTERERPSSVRVGGGRRGGGVTGRAGVGDVEREGMLDVWPPRGDGGGRSSRAVALGPVVEGTSRRWMRFVKKPESLFDERT